MPDLLVQMARLNGACVDQDPELFFSEKRSTVNVAKSICATCPVLARCQQLVLEFELKENHTLYGIYGGLTQRERQQYRHQQTRRTL